jgi:hypothetical protein
MSIPSPISNSPEVLANHIIGMMDHAVDQSDFNALALRVFFYQYHHNTAYRNYSLQLGISPETVNHWKEIPPVPTDAFKLHDFSLTTVPSTALKHTFHTSGTTTDIKGHHHFPTLSLYEHSIIKGWKQADLPRPHQAIILTPTPEASPHSSLSHMMGVLTQHWSDTPTTWGIRPDGSLSFERILHTLQNATSSNEPGAMLGTALAFLHFFDRLPDSYALPQGSWAMETGGYKGSQRQLEKADLYQLFEQKLHLLQDAIINEYSMTELSSQCYTIGLNRPHTAPPWTRIRVIDPTTGADAQLGSPGHLVFYDLANLYSVMAIRTQDLAIAHNDQSFTLLGRDPSALPRGCSRAADASLSDTSSF